VAANECGAAPASKMQSQLQLQGQQMSHAMFGVANCWKRQTEASSQPIKNPVGLEMWICGNGDVEMPPTCTNRAEELIISCI